MFSLDPGLAIWTWIAFAVLFFVLSRFALPKLLQTLKERETMIGKAVDDARKVEQQLADAESERQKVLSKARAEADQILREAREEAEALRRKLAEAAETEAEGIAAQARLRLVEEREAAMVELRDDLAALVCNASEQVIGKSFIGDAERAWAKELVEQL